MAIVSNALVTRQDLEHYAEEYISISDNDSLVEDIINAKTQEFHTYCGVPQIKSRQYTEFYDGRGDVDLFPYRFPIISVSSIHLDSEWEFSIESLLDSADYRIVNNRYIVFKSGFASGLQNIKLIYTAGYASIPNDIKLACTREVVREFNRRRDLDISSISLEDGSVAFVEKGLLKSTKEVLNKYRVVGVY